jgi:hypothetical protein
VPQVDIAGRLAARAPNLQPREATVDGLIYGRRRVDRFAVAPHPLVPAFAEKFVGLLDHRFALCPYLRRLCGKDPGHRAGLSQLLCQSLAVAAGQGRGVVFRRHLDNPSARPSGCGVTSFEHRPAPILLKPAGALLACIVQKPLSDVLPNRVRAVKADRVNRLDFHGAIAAPAGDAHYVALDFHDMSLRQSKTSVLATNRQLRDDPVTHLGLGDFDPSGVDAGRAIDEGLHKDITVHGFRSTFMDWAHETTGYPKVVIDMALAHVVGDRVEAAYRRGDLFDKRQRLMADWARYCAAPARSEVVPLRSA